VFCEFRHGAAAAHEPAVGKGWCIAWVDLLLIEGAAGIALVQQHGDEAVDAVL